jgi:hypothetical protein
MADEMPVLTREQLEGEAFEVSEVIVRDGVDLAGEFLLLAPVRPLWNGNPRPGNPSYPFCEGLILSGSPPSARTLSASSRR